MSVVAIIGAGEIGASTARSLAGLGRIDRVVLIDENESVAAGKALDLRQSFAVTGSNMRVEAAKELSSAAGADVVVLADSVQSGEWSGEAGLNVLRRLARLGCFEHATLVCAGSSHAGLMQTAIDEQGLSRRRALGSAPESLAATARALVAMEARIASNQIALAVIGRPPDRIVVPWSQASAAGSAIESMLAPPQLARVERRLRGLWPPGPGSLGAAAAALCGAAASASRGLLNAFVSLDRDNGTKAPVSAWPVSIGPNGLVRVVAPKLTAREQVAVDEVLQ